MSRSTGEAPVINISQSSLVALIRTPDVICRLLGVLYQLPILCHRMSFSHMLYALPMPKRCIPSNMIGRFFLLQLAKDRFGQRSFGEWGRRMKENLCICRIRCDSTLVQCICVSFHTRFTTRADVASGRISQVQLLERFE